MYLRLGFKTQQIVEMAKVDLDAIKKYIKRYKEKGLTTYGQAVKVKVPAPKPGFRFPEITGKQGTEFFLKREYASLKEKRPWQVLFLIYLKTVLWPRDHEVALAEIAKEVGLKQADVLVILKAYLDGKLHERSEPQPGDKSTNRATGNETSVEHLGGLPFHLRDVCRVRRDQGNIEEEK